MADLLVIDDDKMIRDSLTGVFSSMGHRVQHASTISEGVCQTATCAYDLVFLDVNMPDGNGLKAIPRIRKAGSGPEIVIITGEGDPDGAELAVRSGCWDYIQKPLSMEPVTLLLKRVLKYRKEKNDRKSPVVLKRESITGNSPEIRRCLELVAAAAGTDANVLITGETGTGKELFSRAVHENSGRAADPFVVVDCAALPATLIESIIFGHEKGAFTGADRRHVGLIQQADGGSLFMDEVGELPFELQGVFLRVLQEGCFRLVGDKKEIRSDFRLIAATNQDLDRMVQCGKFRSDLLFRLRSMVIDLPPLRNRKKDTKEIAFQHVKTFCDRHDIGMKEISLEYLEALDMYQWPGNVREMVGAIEHSVSMAREENTLHSIHLPSHIRIQLARDSVKVKDKDKVFLENSITASEDLPPFRECIEAGERQYLQKLTFLTQGNIKKMCRISGISRSNLYTRLKKYGITSE
jgi:two-component system, NtrC family, response regulator